MLSKLINQKIWVFLILLPVVFWWQFLFQLNPPLILPSSDLGTDLVRETLPASQYILDVINQTGQIPLWRNYLLNGAPLIGHPVYPLFYPLNWLIFLLPLSLALNWIVVISLIIMGLGMFLFLRRNFQISFQGSFFGAIIFSQSPRWVALISGGHWPMIAATAWFPWSWLAFEYCWRNQNLRWNILLGIFLAGMGLNHYQTLYIFLLTVFTITLFRIQKPFMMWLNKSIRVWGFAGLIAFGICTAQILPFLQLLPYTARNTLSVQDISYGSLPPAFILLMIFPPTFTFPEWYIYPGIIAVLFVMFGVFSGWTNLEKKWGIIGISGLLLSFGSSTPIYMLFLKIIPGFSLVRSAARWWILPLLSICILASLGFERWKMGNDYSNRSWKFSLFVIGVFYCVSLFIPITFPNIQLPFLVVPTAITFLLFVIILLCFPKNCMLVGFCIVLIGSQWWISTYLFAPSSESKSTFVSPVVKYIQKNSLPWERSFAPKGGISILSVVKFGLHTVDGYDAFSFSAYRDLVNLAIGCPSSEYAVTIPTIQSSQQARADCSSIRLNIPLLKLLGVRWLIMPFDSKFETAGIEPVLHDQQFDLFEIPGEHPMFISPKNIQVVSQEDCISSLNLINPETTALVEESISSINAANMEVSQIHMQANGVSFQIQADTAGLVVRSEAWAPGWKAEIDGSPASVIRVNCALQGLTIPAGVHTVRLYYLPDLFILGIWITSATAIICLLLLLIIPPGILRNHRKVNS